MSGSKTELFILYQMGSTEDYTWYSVAGVFLSEKALRDYAQEKVLDGELKLLQPGPSGQVILPEPVEFVGVVSHEGEVPDVELGQKF